MHFLCHGTTLKKILSIKKLNLTWNKQTTLINLVLCPGFSKCQGVRGMGNLPGGFFYQVVRIRQGVILAI